MALLILHVAPVDGNDTRQGHVIRSHRHISTDNTDSVLLFGVDVCADVVFWEEFRCYTREGSVTFPVCHYA